ncbi:transcriptional regulator [Variovorax sp. J22P240]|uniref:winged helix-turn-helix domain-containing protein n=1 Tax=Variovorax sp. J22P240 TaxID=3053514 RepID=UPI002575FA0F|nr:transcriptional regulator [Variovorax sp. J22P240]MDM0002329.1 transcriptional regulator [Variovorax sp. J22P240]
MAQAQFNFGAFQLQPAERRLLRDGAEVAVTGRALDVLCLLVRKAGDVVTKEELHATVWGGLVVEEANLHVQVSQLRKVLGNDAIATVPRLGYRFVGPVGSDLVPSRAPGSHSRRLSIIVLPFAEPRAASSAGPGILCRLDHG